MSSQENVSSENSSRDIEQHPETTQETQTSGDESTAVSSLDEHESHAQKHVSHTLNHTTNKTTHPEQITQKALPNTGQSSSNGILVGGIVALMGVATLVSRRRRKN
ncbi:LPXTG cell wall anchor domain-containing protein [Staphylococcus simulans]